MAISPACGTYQSRKEIIIKTIAGSTLFLSFALATGCGYVGPAPDPPQAKPAVPAVQAKPDVKADAQSKTPEKPLPEKTAVDKTDSAPAIVREKAAVGMGEKGRGYGGDMLTMPVKTLWNVKEMLVLDQIQHALNIYKAADPNGRGPQSHKEFMDRIIKENSIQLPELPEGQRYRYDPAAGELTVERPANP